MPFLENQHKKLNLLKLREKPLFYVFCKALPQFFLQNFPAFLICLCNYIIRF